MITGNKHSVHLIVKTYFKFIVIMLYIFLGNKNLLNLSTSFSSAGWPDQFKFASYGPAFDSSNLTPSFSFSSSHTFWQSLIRFKCIRFFPLLSTFLDHVHYNSVTKALPSPCIPHSWNSAFFIVSHGCSSSVKAFFCTSSLVDRVHNLGCFPMLLSRNVSSQHVVAIV